ncbi:hypothetical protein U1Q18_009819 [Sarracenia purpurea var. burkii]
MAMSDLLRRFVGASLLWAPLFSEVHRYQRFPALDPGDRQNHSGSEDLHLRLWGQVGHVWDPAVLWAIYLGKRLLSMMGPCESVRGFTASFVCLDRICWLGLGSQSGLLDYGSLLITCESKVEVLVDQLDRFSDYTWNSF